MPSTAKPTLLLVDDEERILRSLAMLFRPTYKLLTTTDARVALEMVRSEPVHVIVSDQRMPIMRGAELLQQVRTLSPNTMRILLTGYSELDAIIASVNEGEIFRFINKPWDANELKSTVLQAATIATALHAPADESLRRAASAAAPQVLVIDDDSTVADVVRELLGPATQVLWAKTVDGALAVLGSMNVGVIVSELNAGSQNVAPLLKVVKAEHPQIVTLVMTPFQDTSIFIKLINQGQVFRFLPKPVRRNLLSMSLLAALKRHAELSASARLRRTQMVEPVRDADELTLTHRISGFLSRLRNRVIPLMEAGR